MYLILKHGAKDKYGREPFLRERNGKGALITFESREAVHDKCAELNANRRDKSIKFVPYSDG